VTLYNILGCARIVKYFIMFIFYTSKHSVCVLFRTPLIAFLTTAYFPKFIINTKEWVELQCFVSKTLLSCEVNE
jgi:hypothetical protein